MATLIVSTVILSVLSYISLLIDPALKRASSHSSEETRTGNIQGILCSIVKLAVMMYVFFIIARQVIGVPPLQVWYMPNLSLGVLTLLSLVSSVPIGGVLYLRGQKKSKTGASPSRLSWLLVISMAIVISGLGHVWAAGVAAGQLLEGLHDNFLATLTLSAIVGVLLVGGASIHMSILEQIMKSQRRSSILFLADATNAGMGSVVTFWLASSVWLLV